jgi:hypothetical protein
MCSKAWVTGETQQFGTKIVIAITLLYASVLLRNASSLSGKFIASYIYRSGNIGTLTDSDSYLATWGRYRFGKHWNLKSF